MSESKVALITGIGGQDGSYLSEFLLSKGYKVRGIVRRSSSPNTARIDDLLKKYGNDESPNSRFYLRYCDLSDGISIRKILEEFKPDEIYNLGAQSHVGISFDCPETTLNFNALGPLRILDAIRDMGLKCKYYQASSSEMFGSSAPPQNEQTPFMPQSPYGISKVAAFHMTRLYRNAYKLFASNGILFNHESPRRGLNFVTRKITRILAEIVVGERQKIVLGNLDAKRDWGFSGDYVEAMWRILQHSEPDDFVIATGETHTVREFLEECCNLLGLDINKILEVSDRYKRPAEVPALLGDATKARHILGWEPKVKFKELARMMVEADLKEKFEQTGRVPVSDTPKEPGFYVNLAKELTRNSGMDRTCWNEPRFGKEEEEMVLKVLRGNYVNEGPLTKVLEEKFREYLGVKHVVLTTNGTAALYLALKADQQMKGYSDFEVIVPDLTMIATATSVGWAGGKAVLADINKTDMTIDLEDVKRKITPKTKAIIPVHVLGRAADMDGLKKIADQHNLIIIEDACGALSSKDKAGRYLGTIGKAGCFSLQSNKIITTGQGGLIVTNDSDYFEMIRRLRDFGRASNKEFIHAREGYNLKFSDLAAALGIAQFGRLEQRKNLLVQQRNQYASELSSLNEIKFPQYIDGEVPVWIDAEVKDRKHLSEYLRERRIYTRDCWPAVHRNPPYQNQGTDKDFPNSSFISDNYIWLPNGPAIEEKDIKRVCDTIKEFYRTK